MGLSQALYQAGVGVKGTDVPTWISIMSERSVPHLQKGTCFLLLGTGHDFYVISKMFSCCC